MFLKAQELKSMLLFLARIQVFGQLVSMEAFVFFALHLCVLFSLIMTDYKTFTAILLVFIGKI